MMPNNAKKASVPPMVKYPPLWVWEDECGIANKRLSWSVTAVAPHASIQSPVIELKWHSGGPGAEIVLLTSLGESNRKGGP